MVRTFRGGIHPQYYKENTNTLKIEQMPAPAKMYFPVLQHIGAPCEPIVKIGDHVMIGQKIADSSAPVSAPIHASVSGTVSAIEMHPHPSGSDCLTIVVDNDSLDTFSPNITDCQSAFNDISTEELLTIVREAGIVGMGGAGFPAHLKLSSALGKIDTLLINCAECEPFLSSDHRMIIEETDSIINGVQILRKFFDLEKATICIEDNKQDAIAILKQRLSRDYANGIELSILETKYPQGGEKQLIKAVTGREVPSGKLPADVKCIVMNVDTAASIFRAVYLRQPVYRRIVTVSGDAVINPKVLSVRIGTPFQDVLDFCSGLKGNVSKIINGGPMMGIAQYNLSVPVIKTTSGILALSDSHDREVSKPVCIHCGKCIAVCPMKLEPIYLSMFIKKGNYDDAENYRIMDCIECGSCSFICPGRLNLVQEFRVGKLKVIEKRRRQQVK
ncbi:MAG: electron transport complex subunit RsxC [Bacillota bacterium]|nr:electron transport complex subunit RsxC [Bacillota bacterium]